MMNMHSKYDNMHKNGMIYVLKSTNNHVISSISCMLSGTDDIQFMHELTWLPMQFKALNILFVCMLSYFECIFIILYNFSLWSKNISFYG